MTGDAVCYVVIECACADFTKTIAVFTDEWEARQFARLHGHDIEIKPLDPFFISDPENRSWYYLEMLRDGNTNRGPRWAPALHSREEDDVSDGDKGEEELRQLNERDSPAIRLEEHSFDIRRNGAITTITRTEMCVTTLARDAAHAVKIANELRAQAIAAGKWPEDTAAPAAPEERKEE
jgi:hypothetical protein